MKIYRNVFAKDGFIINDELSQIIKKYEFVLAGGTALSLQIGHRISYDLDYFSLKNFKTDIIISLLRSSSKLFQVLQEEEDTLNLIIKNIKVSFFHYEYSFLKSGFFLNITPCAQIIDIATMKIIAICQRGTKRDFVDLYFILQTIPFHKIAERLYERFGRERINSIHVGKSMVYFKDADAEPEPIYIKGKEVAWIRVKKFFMDHVKQFVLDMLKSE